MQINKQISNKNLAFGKNLDLPNRRIKQILIVGLGNPGEKYKNTRHNVGFMVADKLFKILNLKFKNYILNFKYEEKFKAEIVNFNQEIILAKPQTFMNLSGEAVAKIAKFYKLKPENILVVHDDIDLPLGQLKIQKGGGTAGHHGLESIVRCLGTGDFVRFRVGIGRPIPNKQILQMTNKQMNIQISKYANKKREQTRNYVLEKFTEEEWKIMKKTINRVVEAIEYYLDFGLERAMNEFN